MADALLPVYTQPVKADSVNTANAVAMRDANGDFAMRRLTLVRSILSGGEYVSDVDKTANYSAGLDDRIILVDASGGAVTITLQAAATAAGQILTVKRTSASNNVILDGNGSETIDGATTKTITTQWGFLTIYCDGTAWFIIASGGTIT